MARWPGVPFQKAASVAWSAITGKPSTFAPSAHSHPISDVTGLQAGLDGKSAVGHTHAYADITGKPSTFAPSAHTHLWADITDKPTTFPPSAHSHAISDITGLASALNGTNTLLGTVNIAEAGLVLLALSVRRVNVSVPGSVTGGNYVVFPVSAIPAGFGIVDCVCTVNGTISFGMLVPIITGNYSIPVRVVRIGT